LGRQGTILLFGLSLFLPAFLFAPWIEGEVVAFELAGTITVTTDGLVIPARIVVRGLVCMFVGAGLVASTDVTSLALGMTRIPLIPRIVIVMSVQTLRWSEVLIEESRGITRAIILRGGSGFGGGWELVRSLPLVWLPRVILRAERVTAAMEMRGYGGELPERDLSRMGASDLVGLGLCMILGILACLVRWMS
jgi:energy-coupling factor transporter transmembrane protein EcfT